MEELNQEEMYCLVAPDGSPQLMTLAHDFPMCIAIIKLLAEAKMGQNAKKLFNQGFKVYPVKVTVTQNGEPDKAFKKVAAAL